MARLLNAVLPLFFVPGFRLSLFVALSESLHRLPTNVGMLLRSSVHEQIKGIAKNLVDRKVEHMFVLGKGPAMPIALEGALKIKEISYIHAEGYPGGALKHGPFALIEEGSLSLSNLFRVTPAKVTF